jgi:ABC-type antimicrobial peptide transport system permease subunit
VAGLLGAMIAARWMAHSLYGVSAGEPAIYTGAVGVLVVAAFIATLAPARRAANVDPVIALRAEG